MTAADPTHTALNTRFGTPVTDRDRLREIVPDPARLIVEKALTYLDRHCLDFIACSPYLVVATSDARGRCDASPRGGPAGFVRVLGPNHLLLPEVTGNRRADTMINIVDNPNIGVMFMIPGLQEILRVNGRAVVVQDEEVLAQAEVMGKTPVIGIGLEVEEAYIHCAKAAMRSSIWKPEGWPDTSALASPAEIIRDHTKGGVGDGSVAAVQEILDDSYANRLY